MYNLCLYKGEKSLLFFFVIFLICLVQLLCAGCIKKKPAIFFEAPEVKSLSSTPPQTESWYVFYNGEIKSFSNFSDIQKSNLDIMEKPWTEAETASGINLSFSPPLFLINKVGILKFNHKAEPELKTFPLLKKISAGDLFLAETGLMFLTFQNLHFSNLSDPSIFKNNSMPFLCKYNPVTDAFSEQFTAKDLNLPPSAQCTHLQKYGDQFFASFKTEIVDKVEFNYFKFEKISDIRKKAFNSISTGTFRSSAKAESVQAGRKYADSLKNLISKFGKKVFDNSHIKLQINVNLDSGKPKRVFNLFSKAKNQKLEKFYAQANYFEKNNCLEILLPNGKFYSLKLKSGSSGLVISQKQLPILPDGFFYTYFSVYKKNTPEDCILAFWEFRDFFKIGKTGFVRIPKGDIDL